MREYARIQEFPDNWEFRGKLSEQYTQIGNAVPTRLGIVVGNVVAQALDELKSRKWKPFVGQREAYRLVYMQSHVRTRRWFKDGKVLVWGDSNPLDAHYAGPKTTRRVSVIKESGE